MDYAATILGYCTEAAASKLTKRAFWSRFPEPNHTAMQAILRSGSPALLAGVLGRLETLVNESPWVDISFAQTVEGVNALGTEALPATVTIDSTVLPLRLTAEQVAALLAPPVGEEVYRG